MYKRRDLVIGLTALSADNFLCSIIRAQSPKPRRVLLAHGLLGFKRIGSVHYFNGVTDCFDKGCQFITPQVDPAGTIKERAMQLQDAIKHSVPVSELKAGVGIHIVAHSMGGLDARYLVSKRGLSCASWFASITTISTPHNGSPLADIITGEQNLDLENLSRSIYWQPPNTGSTSSRRLVNPRPPSM